jgi:hypothetical protein
MNGTETKVNRVLRKGVGEAVIGSEVGGEVGVRGIVEKAALHASNKNTKALNTISLPGVDSIFHTLRL